MLGPAELLSPANPGPFPLSPPPATCPTVCDCLVSQFEKNNQIYDLIILNKQIYSINVFLLLFWFCINLF